MIEFGLSVLAFVAAVFALSGLFRATLPGLPLRGAAADLAGGEEAVRRPGLGCAAWASVALVLLSLALVLVRE